MLMLPELIVIATAFLLLIFDLLAGKKGKGALAPLASAGLLAAAGAIVSFMPQTGELLGGRFGVDSVTWWFKLLFVLATLITVTLSVDMLKKQDRANGEGSGAEYFVVLLFNLAGMMYLASARDLVTLYISLELATIPLFVLAAWKRDARSGEAGLKYVILGALASALFLYGMGLIYGITGVTQLDQIARSLQQPEPIFWLGAVLLTAGIGFKLTLVPFHLWAAEVYQGAPTPVTAYLSVASKGAGLLLMFQVYFRMFGKFLPELGTQIAIAATLTMTVGNLIAVVQKNIKRFMAFSAISQAGYLILGFLVPSSQGVTAMIFYMLVYVLTNLAVFGVIIHYENQTGREQIEDYRGLSRTNPLLALTMMIALFGLAGIPPLSGFVGKFFLFSVAAKAGYYWLVAVAAVNSTVSLYYYLRIVRQMYIEPAVPGDQPLRMSPAMGVSLVVASAGAVFVGLIPFFYNSVYAQTADWLKGSLW